MTDATDDIEYKAIMGNWKGKLPEVKSQLRHWGYGVVRRQQTTTTSEGSILTLDNLLKPKEEL